MEKGLYEIKAQKNIKKTIVNKNSGSRNALDINTISQNY
jgi:hypothetical protein